MGEIVYKLLGETGSLESALQRSTIGLQALENVAERDITSGLVAALTKVETEAKILTGEISKAEIQARKFEAAGASPALVKQFRDAANQAAEFQKGQEQAAKRKQEQDVQAATRQKAMRDDILRHNRQQEELLEQFNTRRMAKEDAAVARQLSLYQSAAQVKASLMTQEQILAQQALKLQEMRQKGLITEIQLEQALGNARKNAAAMARRNGTGGVPLGFIAQQGAIGLQDAVSGYQTNGVGGAVLAAGNNIVQMASLINPIAGTVGALGVAAIQMGVAWAKSRDAAKEAKGAFEAAGKAAEDAIKIQRAVNSAATGKTQADILSAVDEAKAREKMTSRLITRIQGEIDLSFGSEGYTQEAIAKRAALEQELTKIKADERIQQRERYLLENDARNAPVGDLDIAGLNREQNQKLQDEHDQAMAEFLAGDRERLDNEQQILQASRDRRDEEKSERDRQKAEAQAVKDSLRTAQQVLEAEADRLLTMEARGDLSQSEVAKALQQRMQNMIGGPVLARGLVRGSVEEISARNENKARSEQQQMLDKQAEQLLETRRQTEELVRIREKVRSYETMPP